MCYIRGECSEKRLVAHLKGALIPPKSYRTNERIRVPEVRLVDDKGEQLGVVSVQQALSAADERGLDLVEVAPNANPPVCRLMDYGKFRYELTRKERDARKSRKGKTTNELRQVRFRTRIGQHDLAAKTRLVKRLLEEGSKVKVVVMFRGREMDHPQVGMVLLRTVAENLVDDAILERPPDFEGRWLAMVLTPSTSRADKAPQPQETADVAQA